MSRLLLLLAFSSQLNGADFNINDASTYLSYDISSLESPIIQTIIYKASKELQDTGAFVIPQFISPALRDLLATALKSANHIPRKTTRTVFQDKGDFENFDEDSPRNFMFENSMEFVSRIDMETYAEQTGASFPSIALYNYEPLLQFWRKVINSTELFLSTDQAGNVYGFYGQINDWFSWHFDESPFSCITMIDKPESGGFFRYIVMDNALKTPNADWSELGTVLHDEESVKDRIKSIIVNEGDIYCMFGNRTLHEVTPIRGNKPRSVFVMTYGNTINFRHTHNVNNLNQWTEGAAKNEL